MFFPLESVVAFFVHEACRDPGKPLARPAARMKAPPAGHSLPEGEGGDRPAAQSAPSLKLWSVSDLRAVGRAAVGEGRREPITNQHPWADGLLKKMRISRGTVVGHLRTSGYLAGYCVNVLFLSTDNIHATPPLAQSRFRTAPETGLKRSLEDVDELMGCAGEAVPYHGRRQD